MKAVSYLFEHYKYKTQKGTLAISTTQGEISPLLEAKVHLSYPFFQIEHAEAVRPDDAHATSLRGGDQFLLQRDAVAADFAEARRQHYRKWNAGRAALFDDADDVLRGQRNERDIAGLGHRRDIGVADEVFYFSVL